MKRIILILAVLCSLSTFAEREGGGGEAILCYQSESIKNLVEKEIKENQFTKNVINLRLELLQHGFKPQLRDLYEVRKKTGFPANSNKSEIKDFAAN